jgi:hypothetical protein
MHTIDKKVAKKVAIIQSNYIPWVGYFAMIAAVDLFVVYECVQYTKNDWRNRNQILSNDGRLTWLSIPIRHHNKNQSFMDTLVANSDWAYLHFNTIRHHFARTPGWTKWCNQIESLYKSAATMTHLFEINRLFLNWSIRALGVSTPLLYLDSYPTFKNPNERLISILKDLKATEYLSGPAGQNYIQPNIFLNSKIDLNYANYDQLIDSVLVEKKNIKKTSIIQFLIEGKHEFRCN